MKSTSKYLLVVVLVLLAMVSVACTTDNTTTDADTNAEPTLDMTTDTDTGADTDTDTDLGTDTDGDTTESAEISGTVTATDDSMMVEGSTVTVQLVDVTQADAPAEVLAESVIQDVNAFPVEWTLDYDASLVEDGDIIAVQAVVTDGDNNLLYTNTSQYRVLTDGNPGDDVEITVEAIQ